MWGLMLALRLASTLMWVYVPDSGRINGRIFGMGTYLFVNNTKFVFWGVRVISSRGMLSLYPLWCHNRYCFTTSSSSRESTTYAFSLIGNPLRSLMNLCLFSLQLVNFLNNASSLNQIMIYSLIVIGGCWFGGVWYHVLSELTLWFTIIAKLLELSTNLSWYEALWVTSLVIYPCTLVDGFLVQIISLYLWTTLVIPIILLFGVFLAIGLILRFAFLLLVTKNTLGI